MDSRQMEEGTAVRRRRICEQCGERFTTYERIDTVPAAVIKRDGSREKFSREKLRDGILKSCNKRPVSVSQIEAIVNQIEQAANNMFSREISSRQIGEMVMDALKGMDEVAYVRFASVYRQFKDVDSFIRELSALLVEKNMPEKQKDTKEMDL